MGKIRRFARQKASMRYIPGYDECDFENDLLEVLWMACRTYDPNKGASFNTLFWQMSFNHVISLHRKASSQKRVGDYERISLDVEEIREAISELRADPSAEDEYLARLAVTERWRSS
jgi:DNA-directed RNA polymerase specialized sigma24 family protein